MKMNRDVVMAVLTNLAKADSIPQITFRSGTPIEAIIKSFAMSSKRGPDATDVEVVQQWVDQLASFDDARLDQQMDEIADALVAGLQGSVDTIKSIHTIVDDLITKIDERVNQGIALDPKLQTLVVGQEIEFDFPSIDFAPLMVLGRTLPSAMNEYVGASTSTPRNAFTAISERYVSMRTGGAQPAKFTIADEDRALLIKTVNDLSDKWDEDDTRDALNLVLTASRINGFATNTRKATEAKVDYTNDLVEALRLLDTYAELLPKLQEHLSAMGYDEIADSVNFKILLSALEVQHYMADYLRTNVYGDTVMFRNNLLNPDLLPKLKEEGLTLQNLARHRTIIHRDNIPLASGITLTAIKAQRSRVDQLFSEEKSSDDVYRKHKLASLQKRALMGVVGDYFRTEKIDGDAYLTRASEQIIKSDIPLEDVIFDAIVQHKYKEGVVGELQQQLGKAFTAAIKDNPEVDAVIVNDYNMDAYLDVVTTILAKKIVA